MESEGSVLLSHSLLAGGVGLSVGIPGVQNIRLYDGLEARGAGDGGAGDICLLCTCERNAAPIAAAFSIHHRQVAALVVDDEGTLPPIGCVNVIGGPGITHALAGIAEARARGAPILVIATGIRRNLSFSHQIHDVDNLTMLRAVCKTVHRPATIYDLQACVAAAARSAREIPQGPAAVLIPSDMLTEIIDSPAADPPSATALLFPPSSSPSSSPPPSLALPPSPVEIDDAVTIIPVADSGPSLSFARTIFLHPTYVIQQPFFSGPRHGCQDGFGVGTAIGAALAAAQGTNVVVLCTHHDALMQAGLELITAVERKLGIVVIVVSSHGTTPPPSQMWARAVHGTDAGWIKAGGDSELNQMLRLAKAARSSRSVVFASVYGYREAVVGGTTSVCKYAVPLADVLTSAISSAGVANIVGIKHAPHSVYSLILDHVEQSFQCQSNMFTVLTCEDGLAAGFVADGCARSTGRPAILVASAGSRTPPQVFSGVGEAFMDRTPIVLILVEEDEADDKDDDEVDSVTPPTIAVDHASIASAVCNRMHYPKNTAELYDSIVQAAGEASGSLPNSNGISVRVGSVGVVISKSLLNWCRRRFGNDAQQYSRPLPLLPPLPHRYQRPPPPPRHHLPRHNKTLVDKCAHDLTRARVVWIHAGVGAASASPALSRLVRSLETTPLTTSVIVSTTFSGKGIFDETSPNWLWAGLGRGLPPQLTHFVHETFHQHENSVGLIIGAQLSEVATSHFQVSGASLPQTIWHVDLDETVLGRNIPSDYCVTADATAFVGDLLDAIAMADPSSPDHNHDNKEEEKTIQNKDKQKDPVLRKLLAAHTAVLAAEQPGQKSTIPRENNQHHHKHPGIDPRILVQCTQTVSAKFHDDDPSVNKGSVIFSSDSGNSTIFSVECLRLRHGPRHFIAPTDYSSMGYSTPAAIGAAFATQTLKTNVPTVAFVGDGAFLMTGLALSTAKKLRLPIVVIVLRDGELGMMSGLQRKMKQTKDIFCTRLPPYSLESIANILGVNYFGVELLDNEESSLEKTLSTAFVSCVQDCAPVVVECCVDYRSAHHESWFARGLSAPATGEAMVRPNGGRMAGQGCKTATTFEDTGWTVFVRAATRWGTRTAIQANGIEGALTYRQLAHRVCSMASFLTESLQGPRLSRGDRVGMWLDNCTEVIVAHFACAKIGAIVVNLNIRLTAPELAYVLSDANPACVIATEYGKDILLEAIQQTTETSRPCLRSLLWCGHNDARGNTTAATLSATGGVFSPHPYGLLHHSIQEDVYDPYSEASRIMTMGGSVTGASDIWHLYYTSGTTGRPKGVALSHRAMCTHAFGTVGEFNYTAADVWGHFAPMYHVADAFAIVAITIVGGSHVLQREYSPLKTLRTIAKTGVTVTNVGSSMLTGMVHTMAAFEEVEEKGKSHVSLSSSLASLRMLSCGGSPVPADTIRRFRSAAPADCIYFTSYGMTETCGKISMTMLPPTGTGCDKLNAGQIEAALRTSGRPFLSIEVRVVKVCKKNDTSCRPQAGVVVEEETAFTRYERVATDGVDVGQVQVRGPTLFGGYWGRPHATQSAFTHDGWFKTGDVAVVETIIAGEVPYLTVVDRRRDLILVGGENVYTSEVENVLYDHVCVKEACVYGVPEAVLGQVVKTVVVLDEQHIPLGIEEEVIQAALETHCEKELAIFKRPVFWEIRREALPRTGSGKVKRNQLRDRDLVGLTPPLKEGTGTEKREEDVAVKSSGSVDKEPAACYLPYQLVWRDASLSKEGALGPLDHLFCIAGKGVQAEGMAGALMTEWRGAVGHHCKRLTFVTSPACLAIGGSGAEGGIAAGKRHIVFLPGDEDAKSQTDAAQHLTKKVATIVKHATASSSPINWCLWIVTSNTAGPSHRCLSALAKVVNAEYSSSTPTAGRCCVSLEMTYQHDEIGESLQTDVGALAKAVLLEMQRLSSETELRLTVSGKDPRCLQRRQVRRLVRHTKIPSAKFICDPNGLYVVTGAFGGVGFELCRWLVRSCGCQRLIMTVSSLPLSEARQTALENLRQSSPASATFDIVPVDMSYAPEVKSMLRQARLKSSGKLRGVFHLAGTHRDDLLEELDDEKVRAVMSAKIVGAWALLEGMQETFEVASVDGEVKTPETTQLSRFSCSSSSSSSSSSFNVDDGGGSFLCLFSSIFSVLGFQKLGHYAAANCFLDAIKPSTGTVRTISINWGTFEGAGMAHRLGPAWADHWQQGMGMRFVKMERAWSTLSGILGETKRDISCCAGVFGEGMNWREFVEATSYGGRGGKSNEAVIHPLLEELVEKESENANSATAAGSSENAILKTPRVGASTTSCSSSNTRKVAVSPTSNKSSTARTDASSSGSKNEDMKHIVVEVICTLVPATAFRLDDDEEDLTLVSLGLDSLMTPRLRARLQKRLGIKIPATVFFRCPSVLSLAAALEMLVPRTTTLPPPTPSASSSNGEERKRDAMESLLQHEVEENKKSPEEDNTVAMQTAIAEALRELGVSAKIDGAATFASLGVDSLTVPRLRACLQKRIGRRVPATTFLRHASVGALARALVRLVPRQ